MKQVCLKFKKKLYNLENQKLIVFERAVSLHVIFLIPQSCNSQFEKKNG